MLRTGAVGRATGRRHAPSTHCTSFYPSRRCFVHSRVAPLPHARHVLQASKADTAQAPAYKPTSARDAIETGTNVLKDRKDAAEAIRLFQLGLEMNPNDDETRAALYNLGCALAKQRKWAEAADSIVKAINDHSLKLSVALKVGQVHGST